MTRRLSAPDSCRCGIRNCHKRNTGFFLGSSEIDPNDRDRAKVLWWDVRNCWTWCPIVNGEDIDDGYVMGHYDTWELAFQDALSYTRGTYSYEKGLPR